MKLTKIILLFTFLFCALVYVSCKNSKHKEPVKNPKDILSNFNSFWKYWNKDVKLSEDFVAYNENDAIIDREFFLMKYQRADIFLYAYDLTIH